MAGHLNGVQAKIQHDEPRAHYVHCAAHTLNLCLQECGKQSKPIRDALALVNELSNFIRLSPRRLAQFEHIQSNLSSNLPSLKPLCPTRWIVRTSAILSVIKNYKVLQEEFDALSHGTDEAASKASGLLINMEQFHTFFGLKLSYIIFVTTEQLATTLQKKDITAQMCIQGSQAAIQFLQRQRTEADFNFFYDAIVTESKDLTTEPKLPRRRQPLRCAGESDCFHPNTPKDFYRHLYYEAFDITAGEIARRFEQKGFRMLNEIENMLIPSCNGTLTKPSEEFIEMYKGDVDFEKLMPQLSMLPELLKVSNKDSSLAIREVTTISTICELMNTMSIGKAMFSEIHALLLLYLTIPMTSATAERTFSKMRRLKNYLRSNMSQERLNHNNYFAYPQR